ncbi:hypothetical protein [Tomitella cavernea]|uniref:Uncharacterized protein n=1 Tax=Tomitella cavernea TaxID=1387982 RepID=A0ABP9D2K2_9ACTN|nr:hypothetical protein [Tomitella cavernea]
MRFGITVHDVHLDEDDGGAGEDEQSSRVEVHIIAVYHSDVCAVRDAVTPLVAAPVDVIVGDLEAPTDLP